MLFVMKKPISLIIACVFLSGALTGCVGGGTGRAGEDEIADGSAGDVYIEDSDEDPDEVPGDGSGTAAREDVVYEQLREPLYVNSSMLSRDDTCDYNLIFEGDWDLVESLDYKKELENLFVETYPKICARWDNFGPRTIWFAAEADTGVVAYCSGSHIVVDAGFANECPYDIGYFAHELTHAALQYTLYFDWWEEALASYAGFRYFHWAHDDTASVIDQHRATIGEWYYEPYGDCMLFYAYMDWFFPTVMNDDGSLTLGLIDSMNKAICEGRVTSDSDPCDPSSEFNRVVYEVTGRATIEELRVEYVNACYTDSWVFTGFSDYEDNFLTDPEGDDYYASMSIDGGEHGPSGDVIGVDCGVDGGSVGAVCFDDLPEYENVLSGAAVVRSSGFISDDEQDAFLVDGDLTTKWCATYDDVYDVAYRLDGVADFIVIDLGEERDFNCYTLYNAGTVELPEWNASSWELLASVDGENFRPVDYQADAAFDICSVMVEDTRARYLMLKVYTPDCEGWDTLRLYELTAGLA